MQDQSVKSVYRNVVYRCVVLGVHSKDICTNQYLALPEAYCYGGITDFPTCHANRIFPSAQILGMMYHFMWTVQKHCECHNLCMTFVGV